MPNLSNSVLQRLPVYYPGLESQAIIIDTFTVIEKKTITAIRRQATLQELFSTLLNELMSGKISYDELDLSKDLAKPLMSSMDNQFEQRLEVINP